MAFNLYQLDAAEYEAAESPEGQAYGEDNPDFGRWTASFISYAYRYDGMGSPCGA